MEQVSLTVELVQNLDIKAGRLLGIIKNPENEDLVKEYDLDLTQSLLWYDVVLMLNSLMEIYEYEDLNIAPDGLGKIVKKILRQPKSKFPFLKALVGAYDDERAGTVFWETIEDIQLIYDALQKEIDGAVMSQEDIQKLVEGKQSSPKA